MSYYPTEEELKAIEEWDTLKDCEGLAEFVVSKWSYGVNEFSDWRKDEDGKPYRLLVLATAGWSGNEDIISALHKNLMFNMICWRSSHRGGLHIYHIRKLPPNPQP